MKKICIIGASGQLATIISKKLSEKELEVYGTYRKKFPRNPESYSGLLKMQLDSKKESKKINSFLKEVDDIIFLVGKVEYLDQKIANRNNYNLLKNFIEMLSTYNKKRIRIILFSSSAVYGKNNEKILSESSHKEPINFYGKSKLKMEQELIKSGLKYVILRFPMVFGINSKEKFKKVIDAVKKDKTGCCGDGTNKFPFIHENDLVQALFLIINKSEITSDDFNLSSGTITQNTYWKKIFSFLKIKKSKKYDKNILLKKAKEQFDKYHETGDRPRIYKEYIDSITRNRKYDCKKANKILNWSPKNSSKKALQDTFNDQVSIITRKDGIKILKYLFPKKMIPTKVFELPKKISKNDILHERGNVYSMTIRGEGIIHTKHLFSRNLENINKFIKENISPNKLYILRSSPPSKDILYHGSFIYDNKSFGEDVPITLSDKATALESITKNKLGKQFKIFPRDLDTSISLLFSNGLIKGDRKNLRKKIVKELEKDIKTFKDYIKKTNKEDKVIPVLFIINIRKGVQYFSLGLK